MTPTKEQIEAARAWTRDEDTREQAMLLREENRIVPVERTVSRILLAALEAAEERIALLEPIAVDAVAHDLDADDLKDLVRTLERKCDQLEAERDRNAEIGRELKELAEIGRLAVEHRKARQAYHADSPESFIRTESVDERLWNDWVRKEGVFTDACDAYLAKQKEPKP